MPDYFSQQFTGVADGTQIPARKVDAGQVGAKVSTITASKPIGQAIAAGDRLYLGRVRAGERVKVINLTSDTSLGTTTVSVGTTALPAKYTNAQTMTTVNRPTVIGPNASTLDDGALTADEDLWATFGVAGIAGAVIMGFDIEISSVK